MEEVWKIVRHYLVSQLEIRLYRHAEFGARHPVPRFGMPIL
jgi:hypothetical protein